jgi:NAD(P)-dependent dehydrogenase (short-subunit alcohol dehydrogenase family)
VNDSQAAGSAIVTGSANGLGRAIAVRLAQDGWRIALVDVDDDANRETLALVEARGGSGRVEHLDVSDPDAWCELIDRLRNDWPQLDLLVNNAGVATAGEVGEHSLDNWHWIMGINLFGAIYGCHCCVPWMKENPHGAHLVNVASVAAVMCAPAMAAYNVTKAGVVALTETLYSELLPTNIGVTVVCPGFVQTNILDRARYRSNAQLEFAAESMRASRLTADHLADQVMRAIERRQLYLFLPASTRWNWWHKRFAPRQYLAGIGRGFRKLFVDSEAESLDSSPNENLDQ